MKIEMQAFRTKVGQRVFTLFIICAVVPVTLLAWISFFHVQNHLAEQTRTRLVQESKNLGLALLERLNLLGAELSLIATNPGIEGGSGEVILNEKIKPHFRNISIITKRNEPVHLLGRINNPPSLTPEEIQHLHAGNLIMKQHRGNRTERKILLFVPTGNQSPEQKIVVGEIETAYLWEVTEGRSSMTEMMVLDQSFQTLFASKLLRSPFPADIVNRFSQSHSGHFEFSHEATDYLSSFWTLYLKPKFSYPHWTIVLMASKADTYAPMREFKRSFPVIIILTLGLVFLLSVTTIRRTMKPIEILRKATNSIAEGNTGTQVAVKSGDEFELLGNSFNEMSKKLKETQNLLIRGAKLSTMGQMAAGVMHEIKQPLTAITGLLEISILIDNLPGESKKRISSALEAVRRLNTILQRFSSFSHVSNEEMEILSIKQVIDQVYSLLEHQFVMNQITCTVEIQPGSPALLGDKQGLQQIFSNMVINAMHALEHVERDQKTIRIKAYSRNRALFVEIQDNGFGMSEEVQKHIFDPFFTTKGAEKGTGLGMAIVESIVHKHKAHLSVSSEVDVGTRFTIRFPAHSVSVNSTILEHSVPSDEPVPMTG